MSVLYKTLRRDVCLLQDVLGGTYVLSNPRLAREQHHLTGLPECLGLVPPQSHFESPRRSKRWKAGRHPARFHGSCWADCCGWQEAPAAAHSSHWMRQCSVSKSCHSAHMHDDPLTGRLVLDFRVRTACTASPTFMLTTSATWTGGWKGRGGP